MQYNGIIAGKPVRENWDYVPMAAYSADMKEATERATGALDGMRRRAENAERLLAEIVLAAGGKIKIHEHDLHDPSRNITWETWRNPADCTIQFVARL